MVFQYLHYKKDLAFQKPLEKETEKEKFLVNNRDLIIKKNLSSTYGANYNNSLFAPFLFLRFIKNEASGRAANNLVGLADSTKKMTERLRFYPFGLSAQKQINNFLAQPERNDIQKDIIIEESVKNITLRQVSFGKVNHLTGENGSGKSTIMSLIMEKIAYAEHENLIENGLSTGQKQLADLNQIFATSENKEIFIFDEADNALDENNKKEFRQKIEKISKKKLEFGLKEVVKNLKNLKELLKDMSKKKKEIERNFTNKFKELQRQSEENQKCLREKSGIGTLPSEREKTDEQIKVLNAYNKTIEEGFKEGKINVEIIAKLRKEVKE
ncbi:8196_t:CDS:2 [Funneliformis geosporum]|uniref:8196_t:CDS:1 n=1 Tax=Funneliformis geosporum TaxID=1117311 RepID=A0A9W4SK14_9GLOM|nr:8196_t:CDS:2 [Funneliformis geosporum]